MAETITIFDTTLRDGEQAAGAGLNWDEKLEIAKQLDRLGVDVIEAGFPASSTGNLETVQQITKDIRRPVIAGLARCVPGDIDAAYAVPTHYEMFEFNSADPQDFVDYLAVKFPNVDTWVGEAGTRVVVNSKR